VKKRLPCENGHRQSGLKSKSKPSLFRSCQLKAELKEGTASDKLSYQRKEPKVELLLQSQRLKKRSSKSKTGYKKSYRKS
jgi:hypothetical protein